MYILKNAFVSITRNKGRNLLIGIIIIVIACAVSITLAIRQSANSLIDSYENKYDVKATIGINRESMRQEMKMDNNSTSEDKQNKKEEMNDMFKDINNISVEDIKNYADSTYVKSYYYQISTNVDSSLEKVSLSTTDQNMPQDMKEQQKDGDFNLIGYSSLSAIEDFISGKYSITDGKISSDLDSSDCVINSELASLNNLKVGDKITLTDPNNEDNTLTLTITGIYEESSQTDNAMDMFSSSANMIITNANIVEKFTSKDEDLNKTITPTFILNNKSDIDKFKEEVTNKGLNENLTINTNLDEIENSTTSITNVKTFATTFLIITLVIGGIVLFIINMINIRERKFEIGVLRTIGMKKKYLTLQFLSELLIVAIISLLIGASIGAVSSVPISNSLLKNEINNASTEQNNINKNFGGHMENKDMKNMNGIAKVEEFTSIDAVVDFKVLAKLMAIGISLTILSSIACLISIQKFSPLSILKERS